MSKKYLLDSSLSITAIAELLQFSEISSFDRFFRRLTGSTPQKFRDKKH